MSRNRKLLIAIFLIVLSLGTISWFVLFEYSVKWVEERLFLLTKNLEKKGYTFSYSSVKFTGNPTLVKATFLTPHIKHPKGLFEWQGQEVDIYMNPWNFLTLTCSFPGDQKVFVPQNLPIPLGVLQFEDTSGVVKLTFLGKIDEVNLKARHITSVIGPQVQPIYLEETSLNIQNVSNPLNLKVSFSTNVFNIDKILKIEPLDHPLTVDFEGSLSGFQSQMPPPKSLMEWRDGGGVLDVSMLKFTWSPIRAEAEGALTMDKDMYPLGSFASRIVGYQEALTYLIQLGLVKQKNAAAASFVLELFSQPDENGTKRLKIPITLQNKRLSVGPASLLKLRPLEEM